MPWARCYIKLVYGRKGLGTVRKFYDSPLARAATIYPQPSGTPKIHSNCLPKRGGNKKQLSYSRVCFLTFIFHYILCSLKELSKGEARRVLCQEQLPRYRYENTHTGRHSAEPNDIIKPAFLCMSE